MRDVVKGSYLRHKVKEDWGIGQVKMVTAEVLTVFFEHAGSKPIAQAYVRPMLVPIPADTVPEQTRALLGQAEQKVARATGVAFDKLCKSCAQPLKRVVYADKRNWKSCSKCSTKNGSFHTFYEFPRAFSELGGKASDMAQRNCARCRDVESEAAEGRFCGTL